MMSCFSSCYGKKASSAEQASEGNEGISSIRNVRFYSYNELKTATENFSRANKIGQGGFGVVYKGTLKNGLLAAVKVLSAESRQGVKEFLTEINVITSIEHDNLVKLYGCCVEEDHRILVYGYLENNSLAQTLLGRGNSTIQFSWQIRREICIGVARGLAFLHEEVQPHVIHRDVKASNILLDKDLTPKISDFGLAKLIPAHLTHISTCVAGTTGYLAPEYAIRGQVTRKADVYGFGVLLLEVVCGRCNIERLRPGEEQYLLKWIWELHTKERLVDAIDLSLKKDFDLEEACRFLKIGLLCTQDIPKLRPFMSTVVKMLTGEVDVNDKTISKPGMLPELLARIDEGKKDGSDINVLSNTVSSGKLADLSSSSENIATSNATMTFNSIFNRSN